MNITRAAIERSRVTLAFLLVIAVAGIWQYTRMPQAEDPGFTIRTALVVTHLPGAGPERVEELVTDKLERAIQEIPQLDFIASQSKPGISIIFVNIEERFHVLRPIWDDLRRKIERAARELPADCLGPYVNDEFGDVFGIIVMLTGEGFASAGLKDIADEVRNELLLVDQVGKIELHGIQEERIFVEYHTARLAELGLSVPQLKEILGARNIINPGGTIYTDREQIILEPTGNYDDLNAIRKTVIPLPGSREVAFLGDLVTVRRGYTDPPTGLASWCGQPAVAIAVNLEEGGNIITLGEEINRCLERFRRNYPLGIEFHVVADQPRQVSRKVDNFVRSLLQSVAIVVLVMFLFLGLRTGLVVAALIPMTIVAGLLVMSWFHIGIDQVSLASLVIALGMLVDNAIVMSEAIMVGIGEGETPVAAAVDAATELRVPLLTSSLTTAAAFLPIFLAESLTGEYTAPIFKVLTITLLSSWLLSLTMTPLLCTWFVPRPQVGVMPRDTAIKRWYRRTLTAALRHPLIPVALVGLAFVTAVIGFGRIPQVFFPPNDKPICFAELRLPVGSPIVRTREVVAAVDAWLATQRHPRTGGTDPGTTTGETSGNTSGDPTGSGIIDWAAFIGKGAPRYVLNYIPEPDSPEYAYLLINATAAEWCDAALIPRLKTFCREQFPDLTPFIRLLYLGPPFSNPVEIRLSGPDTDSLFDEAAWSMAQLEEIPGVHTITDNWGAWTKKMVVRVDQARAHRAGITSRDVAISLQAGLSGIALSDFREGDELIPIVLRAAAAERDDFDHLRAHRIFSSRTGTSVPLSAIADLEPVWEPARIHRRNRVRTVTVQAQVNPGVNAIAVAREMDRRLKNRPQFSRAGWRYEFGGEWESSRKANHAIMVKLPVAALVIILLLVGQFNSLRKAFIILLTIPLGIIGVVLGLLVTNLYFGFMTLLGVVSLSGIVVNNAIVLLDRIRIEREVNGREPGDAIVEAAVRRFRPIMLTTLTTAAGLLPLWFGSGPMWPPMAVAIVFGLLFATLLTLGFVPAVYALLYRCPPPTPAAAE
ncbi:MAG: efflux RND transporter permease subunit [Deltaproteobacteria bacterium]|nr:efflux RND transporter permease subunit [Candidatus Anaeroferrophillacea bacterium]